MAHIVWGTRRAHRRGGWVADFCPLCREIRAFAIERVKMVRHIQYIPVSSGQLIGENKICNGCGVRTPARSGDYRTVKRFRLGASVQALVEQTAPDLPQKMAGRLAMEETMRKSGIPPAGGVRQ